MLFRRRDQPTRGERFRVWLWPRVSWGRSARYFLKRTVRLSGTPHRVAMGTAAGAAVAFTPFLGLHVLLALALAWMLRGNLVAAAIGTWVGNPLTYPFIWGATYELGQFFLMSGVTTTPELGATFAEGPSREILPFIKPMAAGAVPLGLAAGCITYAAIYKAVGAHRQARRERFAARRDLISAGERASAWNDSGRQS